MKSVSIRVSAPVYTQCIEDCYVDRTTELIDEFMKKYNHTQALVVFEYKSLDTETLIFENPHYHAVILGVEMNEAFSKRFKRFMIEKDDRYRDVGKGGKRKIYIQDAGELERCYVYLCKGNSKDECPIVCYNSIVLTDDEIMDYHNQYWDKYDNKIKVVEEKEKVKPNPDKVFLDWFREKRLHSYKRLDMLTNKEEYAFICEEIVEDILQFYKAHDKGFKKQLVEHKLHLIYNSVIREYRPDMHKEYVRELTKQIQFSNSCFV